MHPPMPETTTAKSNSGYSIAVGCPGCSGALELEEDFFVLTCRFCGSVLRVVMPDTPPAFLVKGRIPSSQIRAQIDRFLKERDLPLTTSGLQIKSLYYPYWKIDGLLVKVRNRKERRELQPASEYDDGVSYERDVSDINVSRYSLTIASGVHMEGIPISIGMRADYVKLHPFGEEEVQEEFDTMPLMRPCDHELQNLALTFASAGEFGIGSHGVNKTELYEPAFSLIYFPYYVVEQYGEEGRSRYLVDGVSGRILHFVHPRSRSTTGPTSQPGPR